MLKVMAIFPDYRRAALINPSSIMFILSAGKEPLEDGSRSLITLTDGVQLKCEEPVRTLEYRLADLRRGED